MIYYNYVPIYSFNDWPNSDINLTINSSEFKRILFDRKRTQIWHTMYELGKSWPNLVFHVLLSLVLWGSSKSPFVSNFTKINLVYWIKHKPPFILYHLEITHIVLNKPWYIQNHYFFTNTSIFYNSLYIELINMGNKQSDHKIAPIILNLDANPSSDGKHSSFLSWFTSK